MATPLPLFRSSPSSSAAGGRLLLCSSSTIILPSKTAGMLMAAATHMMDSSSSGSPPPWLPALADHHHHHHQLLHDFTASAPSRSPPPPPPSHHHYLPRAAPAAAHRRVANKRRPRPSRRLPITYISADPASFRRMVQQVTGADDLLPPPLAPEILCRPGPARAGATYTGSAALNNALLPTLDTSAFLVGAAGALARTSDGSAAGLPAAPAPTLAAEAENNSASSSSSGLLFPTLESWDHADLF